jgi:adenylate cyclase
MAKLTPEEMWRQMLTGNYPRLHGMRRMWGALPSPPRCKLCNAPFRGPGGVLMRAIRYGPSPLNRRLCKWCIRAAQKHPGGAEVEISVLFADVRGSTALAERMLPDEFSRLMARFYGAAAERCLVPRFFQLAAGLRSPPPRTTNARMMKPIPLSISAIPTTTLNSPIWSAM